MLTPYTSSYVAPVLPPLPSPCDTATIAPAAGDEMCRLTVWDAESHIAIEIVMPRRRATTRVVSRVLGVMRSWDEDEPDTYSGPQIVRD